jgi:hypothetical protein
MSGEARWPPEVLRAGGGVGVEGRDSGSCMAISYIYKDACRLAQAKGLPRLIYHEPLTPGERRNAEVGPGTQVSRYPSFRFH